MKTVTLSDGVNSVELKYITHDTAISTDERAITAHTLENNNRVYLVSGLPKKTWEFRIDTNLLEADEDSLDALYTSQLPITLVTDWEGGNSYTVFFHSMKKNIITPNGHFHYSLGFKEL